MLIMLVLTIVFVGCGGQTESSQDETGTSEDTAETNGEEVKNQDDKNSESIELSISHFTTTEHGYHQTVFVPFAEELEELSEGRVTAEIYPGAALGEPPSQ